MTYTAAEKYADAMREVRLRQRVYDRLVNAGNLSRDTAKKRIEIMTEIAEDYRQLAKKEQLFDDDDLIPPAHTKAHRRDHREAARDGQNRTGEPRREAAAQDSDPASPAQTDQGRAGDGETR